MRERSWELAVRNMLEACERVVEFTDGMDLAAFVEDRRTYYATILNVEMAGEAGSAVPIAVWDTCPGIPWRAIVGGWNGIITEGNRVFDDETTWAIVTRDIPDLVPQLRALLRDTNGQD